VHKTFSERLCSENRKAFFLQRYDFKQFEVPGIVVAFVRLLKL